ncbi:hypothetical protein [Paracoccus sp. 228]|uniref:hypothetical protein n=1 Tax=Paracoccus sp. 228 TaxID=1192054 RepID=UPI0005E65B6A|nr:hypothetical protein [Paracoccus sp. 228]KIX17974.1 hypothetical protein SY26_06220 [Paracoccus sp. 228]|tara:strand:- start:1064 stop:1837 length:774 start_codon:yes stop_codon:yes gene_type:complete
MTESIHDLGQGFWSIRGDLRIGGVLNVGTQASLVRLRTGRFVMLDSYPLSGAIRDTVMDLTDGGRAVEAVLNLHPFHTLHCAATARDFPDAALFGSHRHRLRHPDLNWRSEPVESPEVQDMFADDLTFSLPRGIDYVNRNERVHAGSLLAWHPASRTLHVDDTINLMPVPRLLRGVFPNPRVFLHPTLPQALLPQAGAVRDFRDWLQGLAGLTRDLRWLCAAHSGLREFEPGQFKGELLAAFRRVEDKLAKAEARRG